MFAQTFPRRGVYTRVKEATETEDCPARRQSKSPSTKFLCPRSCSMRLRQRRLPTRVRKQFSWLGRCEFVQASFFAGTSNRQGKWQCRYLRKQRLRRRPLPLRLRRKRLSKNPPWSQR